MTKDNRGADLDLSSLAARIEQFLDGAISREEACTWFDLAHASLSACCDSRRGGSAAPALVALLREILAPRKGTNIATVRALARIHDSILDLGERPAREVLPPCLEDALRASGRVKLEVLDRPEFLPDSVRDQWADIGWRSPTSGRIFLIPLCVLARDHFRRRIPDVLSGMEAREEDSFPYHPENDQASFLRSSFPSLAGSGPSFEYWIDDAGFAEVVLDAPRIGREEVLFATRLFCLRNGIRRANLDGRRISWAGVPST